MSRHAQLCEIPACKERGTQFATNPDGFRAWVCDSHKRMADAVREVLNLPKGKPYGPKHRGAR